MSRAFIKGRNGDTPHFWALYVDVEGFSYLYEEHAMRPMSLLTSDTFALLDSGRPEFSGISAVQYGGDGFLLRQNGGVYDQDIKRPVAITCALMKRALIDGFTLRAQLSIGDMSDVTGTYSEEMQDRIGQQGNGGYLSFRGGSGNGAFSNMLFNSLIGTSILNAYRLSRPKGPLFAIDPLMKGYVESATLPVTECQDALLLNWLEHDDSYVRSGMEVLGIDSKYDYRAALEEYAAKYDSCLGQDWKDGVRGLLAS